MLSADDEHMARYVEDVNRVLDDVTAQVLRAEAVDQLVSNGRQISLVSCHTGSHWVVMTPRLAQRFGLVSPH